jgi:hypothetical protein
MSATASTAKLDLEAALHFIDLIAGPSRDDGIFVGLMIGKRANLGTKEEFIDGSVVRTNHEYPRLRSEIGRRIQIATEADKDVYVGAHPYADVRGGQRKDNAAAKIRLAYGDIDEGDIDRLRPTILVRTSPERYQGLWELTAPVDPATIEDLNWRIAAYIGADLSGGDLSQAIRMPGTRNLSRPGLPVVELVYADGPVYDLEPLLARLPPAPTRPSRPSRTANGTNPLPPINPDDDEPPLPLEGDALARFRGELVERKPDGSIDRSKSILRYCRALYDAGLAVRYLREELRAFDIRLGFRKYCDRNDADERYGAIVMEIVSRGRSAHVIRMTARPSVHDEAPVSGGACAGCIERDQTIAALRERIARLDRREAIRRNRGLGAAREGAAEAAQALLDLSAAGPPRDPRGYELPQWRIEREADIPVETLRRHIKTIGALALAESDCERFGLAPETPLWTVETEQIDRNVTTPDGRQIKNGSISRVFIKPSVPVERLAETLAAVELPKAKKHGGDRRCKQHPDAELIVEVTLEKKTRRLCSVCHAEVSVETQVIRRLPSPSVQVDAPEEEVARDMEPAAPSVQVDGSEIPTQQPLGAVLHTVDNLLTRESDPEREARREAERRHRVEDARRLLHKLWSHEIFPRRVGDGFLVNNEELLTDRDAGLLAELTTEVCWLLDVEAARSAASVNARIARSG